MTARTGLVAAAFVLLAVGCGSGSDQLSADATPTALETAETPAATPSPAPPDTPAETPTADDAETPVEATTPTPLETPTPPEVPTPPASATPEPTEPAGQTTEEAPPGPFLAAPGTRTNWSGTIDGDIGFTMWLAQQDRFVRGEIAYDAIGVPIAVVGMASPESDFYVLREFGPDGRVSGSLSFVYDGGGEIADGLWVDLPLNVGFDGVDELPYVFDPLVRPGQYGYSFPPFGENGEPCCGPVGQLTLSNVGSDTATIAFENNRGAPSFNQAILEPTTVALTGNRAVFDGVREDVLPDCAFEIVVFDGFAFVTHLEDRFDCGFGNAAGIEGTYLLTG